MSDLDITIKLDPTQPVQGAKAVTKEVAKLEDQAKSTQKAAEGIAKLNFKQAAAGINQAFSLLNSKLKLTDNEFGAIIGSATQFGSLGAQIAGPWGAGIGAVIGLLVETGGVFDDVIEKHKELTGQLGGIGDKVGRLIRDMPTLSTQFDALTKNANSLGEAIALTGLHLQNLHASAAQFSGLGPVLAEINKQLAAQTKLLDGIKGPRDTFARDMTALNQLLATGAISAQDYVRRQAEMVKGFATTEGVAKQAAGAIRDVTRAQEEQRRLWAMLTGGDGRQGRQSAEAAREAALLEHDLRVGRMMGDLENVTADAPDLERDLRAYDEATAKIAANTARWRKEMDGIGAVTGVVLGQVTSAASELSSTFVDAANGADVSWGQTFRNILTGFEKAIAQALILRALTGSVTGQTGAGVGGGYGGLFGLLGFASGGTIFPSGNGTSDSQTVMFRKSPSETVHINTPAQESAYRRGGGGGGGSPAPATVRVVNEVRRGELLSDRDVVVALGRNRDAVRRLIG